MPSARRPTPRLRRRLFTITIDIVTSMPPLRLPFAIAAIAASDAADAGFVALARAIRRYMRARAVISRSARAMRAHYTYYATHMLLERGAPRH